MIYGVGVDIMNIGRIRALAPDWDDPFFVKTFTESEREQAAETEDPARYFAGRFSGKEAVFKSFKGSPDVFRLDEVEIINDGEGRPRVNLLGSVRQAANEKGIVSVSVSLSSDGDTVIAFAVCEAKGEPPGRENSFSF